MPLFLLAVLIDYMAGLLLIRLEKGRKAVFVITVILFVPVLVEYTKTGMVPRFPTLIVSGFIGLGGVLSLFTGLILSTLAEKDRQEFEFRLTLIENLYHYLLKNDL